MSEQILYAHKNALEVAELVCEHLKPYVLEMEVCGGLRRKKQFVHDIDIVVQVADESGLFFLSSVLGGSFADFKSTEKKIELRLFCDLNKIKVEITPTINDRQFE